MRIFHALLRPTLVRRVFLALLVAFALSWLAIMATIMMRNLNRDEQEKSLQDFSSSALASLRVADSENAASYYLAGLVDGTNRLNYGTRKAIIWAQLRDAKGKLLYTNFTPSEAPEIEARLRLPANAKEDEYFVVHVNTALWTLSVARHRHTFLGVLLDVWGELSKYMLIAFPLIFLPIWLAISSGMRPLQRLSDRIAARHAGDLSALNIDAQYDELKPLASTLDELLLALRNKIQREHAFLSDAAHELRTPMAVILAQTHVLAMADSPSQRLEAEKRMEQAIARSSHLVEQLLQLAHAGHESATAVESFDVAQLVSEELALAARGAMARNIELSLEAPDTLRYTLDRNALQSILHNLVENAIRYVQPGGQIDVKLLEHGREKDSALILAVCDNGPGIADGDRALVFERFHRGTGHGVAGSGLGLAIVKRAVEKLGGEIVLSNGLDDRGCRFEVTIPAR